MVVSGCIWFLTRLMNVLVTIKKKYFLSLNVEIFKKMWFLSFNFIVQKDSKSLLHLLMTIVKKTQQFRPVSPWDLAKGLLGMWLESLRVEFESTQSRSIFENHAPGVPDYAVYLVSGFQAVNEVRCSHLTRWFDGYDFLVETRLSSTNVGDTSNELFDSRVHKMVHNNIVFTSVCCTW